MRSSSVYRWENTIYIDRRHSYRCGEILCAYLNQDVQKIEELYKTLVGYKQKIQFPINHEMPDYDRYIRTVQNAYDELERLAEAMPPFAHLRFIASPELLKLLDDYGYLFDGAYDDIVDEDEMDDIERHQLHPDSELAAFFPRSFLEPEQSEMLWRVEQLNEKIAALHNRYLTFCCDLLRVQCVFTDFLDNYFHIHPAFPTPQQAAAAYKRYQEEHADPLNRQYPYRQFGAINRPVSEYEVLETDKEDILCEVVRYEDIGSFLADELFSGIQTGQLPKRCINCERYFLPDTGRYLDYCDNIAPGETERTCREAGPRKRYDDKVKTDPIWKPYQRAYKAHYARYMKKKMTVADFEAWSRYAIGLRDKMLAEEQLPAAEGTMSLAEYEALLKK